MKIIISGYGRMGREIEKAALERGHEVVATLDNDTDWEKNETAFRNADVVIDFSMPAVAVANIRRCFDRRIPVVTGTTGWNAEEAKVRQWCRDENQAIFAASNFSIGMNLFFRLAKQLGILINKADDYNITLEEIHHIHKLDAPSGTAIRLAEILLAEVDRKKRWVNHIQESPEEIAVISVREGEIPGIHTITCESESDSLILEHKAKSRKGLALGALLAAEWIMGKQGYFEMNDLLELPV
jgi:4-hydroxy-tetrahydrodipicolinate reductase